MELIEDQYADMKRGSFVKPEPRVIRSLDQNIGTLSHGDTFTLLDLLADESDSTRL